MTSKHRHYLVLDSATAIGGRHCTFTGCDHRDERPVCIGEVDHGFNGWSSWRRCNNAGKILHDKAYYPVGDSRTTRRYVGPEGAGWWYCGIHDPVKRKKMADDRDAVWRATMAANRERAKTESDLIGELRRWYADEQATEGFCNSDCEHHECRLARAWQAYQALRGA